MTDASSPADTIQPVRKTVQRLRWFVDAFEDQIARTSQETGIVYHLDEARLGEVFAGWLKAFNAQKPQDSADNAAYVGFAAGLMLRALIRGRPVRVVTKPPGADETNPAYFWPEGYLYVAFCLNARGLVLSTDFQQEQHPGTELADTRTWWSFKENVAQDSSLAIAFLDLFAGDQPDWVMPDMFRTGRVREFAGRFYEPKGVSAVD